MHGADRPGPRSIRGGSGGRVFCTRPDDRTSDSCRTCKGGKEWRRNQLRRLPPAKRAEQAKRREGGRRREGEERGRPRTRPTAWPRRRCARAAPRSRDRGCTKTRGHDAVDRVDRAEERARARPRHGRRADRADGRVDTAPRSRDRGGRSETGGGQRARLATPIARRARAPTPGRRRSCKHVTVTGSTIDPPSDERAIRRPGPYAREHRHDGGAARRPVYATSIVLMIDRSTGGNCPVRCPSLCTSGVRGAESAVTVLLVL